MKKILVMICSILLTLSLTACDHTDDPKKVINVYCESQYINTTESWNVNSHNGYKAYYVTETYDEENDEYVVVLKFKIS